MNAITSELGHRQFLQLLVAQIQHQDPLEPIANENFLAQLAQFSSLESLERLNEQFARFSSAESLTRATDLLGHLATYGDGGRLRGVIDELRMGGFGVEARIESDWIPLARIQGVARASS